MSAVYSKEASAAKKPESNTSLGPSFGFPAVNVCAALSVFENITTSPTLTVAVFGIQHPSTSSHPGTAEPIAGTIVTSAKAAGIVAPIPDTIANSTKKEQIALVFIVQITCMGT